MTIRTSANFYRRGISNNYNNFAFVAQTNNTIISPMHKYLKNYKFTNRNIINRNVKNALYPWGN